MRGVLALNNELSEDRLYVKQKLPVPVLNMGVDIQPEWAEDFWTLQKVLGLGPKETINWVVNAWFVNCHAHPPDRD